MRNILLLIVLLSYRTQAQLPESIVKERSLVIMDLPLVESDGYMVRGDWRASASEFHSKLKRTGVDAVAYLHAGDWDASASSQMSYRLFFAQRSIENVIRLERNNSVYRIKVIDFKTMKTLWEITGGSLNQAVFRLGKEIKKRDFLITNFLPSERAEFFTDIPFSRYTASNVYPDRIRRLPIGVARYEDESMNKKLEAVMESYPFEYELIDYTDDEDAYRKGFQYVLLRMTTAGSSIKKLLNYQSQITETDFISTVKGDSTDTRFKKIPAEANVTKYYFQQTVNHEVFVGEVWDADVTWEKALENFILNLRIAFRKI